MGFISEITLQIIWAVIGVVFIYQVTKILQVNIPILKKGVPEDDRYMFKM
ncbi:hypothetical protein [Paenisporosarcina sp. TG20]|nr:hypothetical protein [Paenisporosarcina sp. TG20]